LAFLEVFSSVVLPVFLIAAAGALLHRWRPIPTAPLGQAILYLFSPALVFYSLATTQVPVRELGQMALFSALLLVAMYLVSQSVALALRLPEDARGTFSIAAIFMNAGNYGLPVALFAFGQDGLSKAVVFFVIQAVLGWTVGVYLASRAQASPFQSVRAVLMVPTTYAAIAGFLAGAFALSLPQALLRASEVLGNAAIPAMLVVLGIQVASSRAFTDLRAIGGSVALRLVVSAFIAYGLVRLLGLNGLTGDVLIVVAGMPTAVFTIILASEYGGRPQLASSIVVVSTVLSLVSVTALLTLVGVG
jgi:predicted permease